MHIPPNWLHSSVIWGWVTLLRTVSFPCGARGLNLNYIFAVIRMQLTQLARNSILEWTMLAMQRKPMKWNSNYYLCSHSHSIFSILSSNPARHSVPPSPGPQTSISNVTGVFRLLFHLSSRENRTNENCQMEQKIDTEQKQKLNLPYILAKSLFTRTADPSLSVK